MTYDLVVIGGGIAGLCAGLRAAERGLKVMVLENGTDRKPFAPPSPATPMAPRTRNWAKS